MYSQLKVSIQVEKLTLAVAGRGIATQLVAARGKQRKTVSGVMNNGLAEFEEKIEYLCFVADGDESREVVKASVYMDTPKGKRKVGTFELPIGSWYILEGSWKGNLGLNECPDKRAQISLSVSIELKRKLTDDEYRYSHLIKDGESKRSQLYSKP